MPTEIPTPRITCKPDGHVAICPDCGQEFNVVVSDVPIVEEALREDGATVRIIRGHTSHHDLSVFEDHYRETHI
jgi:hypothetical protein